MIEQKKMIFKIKTDIKLNISVQQQHVQLIYNPI